MTQLRLSSIDNHRLFSNYYLENRVPKSQAWRDFDKAREAFERVKELHREKKHWLDQPIERQLRKEFIEPVLDLINPFYLVDETIPGGLKPDFIFFDRRESKREKRLAEAIAVGDAKHCGVNFDAPLEKEVRSPVRQIYDYFIQSETRWGILTDGMRWRLMLKDVRQEHYFEVNLVDIVEKDDYDSFRYFFFFFRREAFSVDPQGRCYLDRVIEGSDRYAQEVGEELKDRVYRALLALARGFCKWEANALDGSDTKVRERIRKNCLILLYRFLFLFYAEDWGFLPSDDPRYQEIGLRSRLSDVRRAIKRGPSTIPAEIHSYWDGLRHLFELIDSGNERLSIPPYNGGLFHPASDGGILEGDDFLDRCSIGNRYIAEAIHLLGTATDPETHEEVEVDYSSLETRHLGSIYEGLLEFKLAYAEEPKVVIRRKGKEIWVPFGEYERESPAQNQLDVRKVEQGEVYMETEKHERKVTGTYYTPDYIVKYIVENTVGPVVDRKLKEARDAGKSRADAVLGIKVCDPAMGSGHFLVEATEFLAQRLLDAGEEDFKKGLREVEEFSLRQAKREVASHCIYGVDLNPLAVELCKVSLWLATISKTEPLSFLDHRLKCGNSLIGTWLSDAGWFPGESPKTVRIPPAILERLVKAIREIDILPDKTPKDIHQKEGIHRNLHESMEFERLRTLLDVRTSLFFGNDFSTQSYTSKERYMFFLNDALSGDRNRWNDGKRFSGVIRGIEMARDRSSIHWEIEFPDVFFEGGKVRERPGFDAVVGNPPYVRQEQLSSIKPYVSQTSSIYHGLADIYTYFFEKGLRLTRDNGRLGFISSNKFVRSNYGAPLRRFITETSWPEKIVDFGELPVFPEAATFPAIFILRKGGPHKEEMLYSQIRSLDFNSLEEEIEKNRVELGAGSFDEDRWYLGPEEEARIVSKMDSIGETLDRYVGGRIRFGVKTGFNKAFLIDEATRSALIKEDPKSIEIIKPVLVGDDVRRFQTRFRNRYLIWTYGGVEIHRYPAIKKHLGRYQKDLEKRWDKGEHWYELRACDYYSDFDLPKIVYPDIAISSRFTIDKEGYFPEATCFEIPVDDPCLLSLLNSRLILFYIRSLTPVLGDTGKRGRLRFKTVYLKRIPIRKVSYNTSPGQRVKLLDEAKQLYSRCLEAKTLTPLLDFVESNLPKDIEGNFITEKERSDVIHDVLGYLANQMIEMYKQQQNRTDSFFTDLEGTVDEETLENLKRGKQGRSLFRKEACRAYVKKDSHTTYHLDGALTWSREAFKDFVRLLAGRIPNLSEIMLVFDKHQPTLQKLQERIDMTDDLIDQIVYCLYALTDEEIGIVEGSFGKASREKTAE